MSSWSYREPLTHSYYLPNVRIIRKLLPDSTRIFMQTWEKEQWKISDAEKEAITVSLANEGIIWQPMRYRPFGLLALASYTIQLLQLMLFVQRQNIGTFHPFAPAAGTSALLMNFFMRRLLIVDSWEPHAECMVQTGAWKKKSIAFRILWWSEKKQSEHADVLIAASPKMIAYAGEKFGGTRGKVLFRPACVDLAFFDRSRFDRNRLRTDLGVQQKVVCVCASKLGGLYLEEDVFRFFKAGQHVFGEKFHALLLSEYDHALVNKHLTTFGLSPKQLTHIHVAYDEMPKWLSIGDFAFNPQNPVPAKRYGTPVKDGEYWAMGLPVVLLPDISEDSDIVSKEKAGVVLKSLRDEDMLDAMQSIQQLLSTDSEVNDRVRKVAEKYRTYKIAEHVYSEIYGMQS